MATRAEPSNAALLGSFDVDDSSATFRAKVKLGGKELRLDHPNPYDVVFDSLATFLVAFIYFTVGTQSRALGFGDDWIGMVAIGGITAACYVFLCAITGSTITPHFDIFTILLSLKAVGIHSFRKNAAHVPKADQVMPCVRLSAEDGQFRYTLGPMYALALIVALFAAAFASAGFSKLILDSAYNNAEIVIRDANFNAGEAFFVELVGSFFLTALAVLLPLNGIHPINIAILLGLVTMGFQAYGFNVSSASFNLVRWLSVNAVAGSSAWSSASWVWPVAPLVASTALLVIFWVMSWALRKRAKYANANQKRMYESTE